jgi:hypothetical protein
MQVTDLAFRLGQFIAQADKGVVLDRPPYRFFPGPSQRQVPRLGSRECAPAEISQIPKLLERVVATQLQVWQGCIDGISHLKDLAPSRLSTGERAAQLMPPKLTRTRLGSWRRAGV